MNFIILPGCVSSAERIKEMNTLEGEWRIFFTV